MLERLQQLLPPPAAPVEPGRPDGWPAVEQRLGTALPTDFKAFTERYGSGTVDDFLYLFNPFAAGEDGNLLVEKDRVLDGYRQTRARFPDRLPLPPFPDEGGVLPVGRTDNGDELYWVTDGDPDDWPLALLGSRAALQELHRMPMTGFLAALAANHLASRILPHDLLGRPSHQFHPPRLSPATKPVTAPVGSRSGWPAPGRQVPRLASANQAVWVPPGQHGHAGGGGGRGQRRLIRDRSAGQLTAAGRRCWG